MKEMKVALRVLCCCVLGVFLSVSLAILAPPREAAAQANFKGKRVKVIVGYPPGGGYDVYARVMARHLGKHLPGTPTVVIQNMGGAASLVSVNYLYNRAPRDGTEFGTFARNLPLSVFMGESKQARFDPLKLTWIGTPSSYRDDAYLLMVRKNRGISNINDMRKANSPEVTIAATSFGGGGHDIPLVLRDTLGLNLRVAHGYPGGNSLFLAVDRGEMDGRMVGYSSVLSAHREWLAKDSSVITLLQFARETRHPDLPNVPTARELARTQDARDLIELLEAPYFLARPFAGPPGIPAPVTEALRDGFMAAHADPNYLKEAAKLSIDVSPLRGDQIARIVERMSKMPRSLYERYASILANPKSAPRKVNWQIMEGKIAKLSKKGRFEFDVAGKTYKSRMSNGYTKLTVGGKKAKIKSVKPGMTCKIWFEGDGSYAGTMECSPN